MAMPGGAVEVPWRLLVLPEPCEQSRVFVVEGGNKPALPAVRFPIRDEKTFREAFPCAGEQRVVDFSRERVEKLEGYFPVQPAWAAVVDGRLVITASHPGWCMGVAPEILATLIVVPADAPELFFSNCRTPGECKGPPPV